jgi:flagellar motility protein MotE (MotC chaperone)
MRFAMQRKLTSILIAAIVAFSLTHAFDAAAQDEKETEGESKEEKAPDAEKTEEVSPESLVPQEFASMEEYLKNLEDQRRSITRERQALVALRVEVRTDIDRLLKLQTEIDSRLNAEDEAQTAKIKKLISIYSKMKPEQVVPLLNNLGEKLRLRVIYSMKTKDQAKILALMSPEKAADITKKIMKKDFQ